MLPSRWLAVWTNPLALVVSIPTAPITHFGRAARDILRPYNQPWDLNSPEALALRSEVDLYKTLYAQANLDREFLERSLASVGAISARGGGPVRLVECSIVGTSAGTSGGTAQLLRLNAGSSLGLLPGATAFLDNDSIAGVVGSEISSFSAFLVPVERLSGIAVRLFPDVPKSSDIASYPGAVLRPTGRGTWSAEVASGAALTIGMTARLADERWPRIALGARVGEVIAIEPIEQAPLASRIEVRPIVSANSISSITIAIPESQP